MGILSKFIGLILVLSGLYGLFLSIPSLLYSYFFDLINPLVKLGIVKPSATSNVFDVGISFIILIIGIVLVARKSKPKLH